MKVIAFADLHINDYKKFDKNGSRLAYCLKVLDLVFEEAYNRRCDLILFAGDFFDQVKAVSTIAFNSTVLKLKELFAEYSKLKLIAVAGNHDYATKTILGQTAQTSLDLFPIFFPNRFHLLSHVPRGANQTYYEHIDNNGEVFYIHGVEYFEFAEEYYEALRQVAIEQGAFNLLLTHATLLGFDFMQGHVDPYHSAFERFDFGLSGDIHRRRDFGKVMMLGSPMQQDYTDMGDEKGFYYFDFSLEGERERKFISTKHKLPNFWRLGEGKDPFVEIPEFKSIDYLTFIPKDLKDNSLLAISDSAKELEVSSFDTDTANSQLLEAYCLATSLSDPGLIDIGKSYLERV